MNRLELETQCLQEIKQLPMDKLVEVMDFVQSTINSSKDVSKFKKLRGVATANMTTDEIMKLTRAS